MNHVADAPNVQLTQAAAERVLALIAAEGKPDLMLRLAARF